MSVDVLRGMLVSAVTLAVAWTASATARYSDYSGARMPFYHEDYSNKDSIPRDDYPERSPDASVPLDYKYEEPSGGKYEGQAENRDEQNGEWQVARNKDQQIDAEEEYNHELDFSEGRDTKSNQRIENQPLINRKNIDYSNLSRQGRQHFVKSKSGSRHFDKTMEIKGDSEIDIRNKIALRGGVRRFRSKKRRARERDDMTSEAIFEADRSFESDDSELESSPLLSRRGMGSRRKNDGSFSPHRDLGSIADKHYPNYEEYYDMKRALNIRNNLLTNPPTKVSATPRSLSVRPLENWFRRANIPEATFERNTLSESTLHLQNTTTTAVTVSVPSLLITSVMTTISNETKSNLSLAEKSRLSILKKAQRKESLGGSTATVKPPVLMQVTDRLQTVVMVESPGSRLQQMRAREISDDSPERILRAKRLMRHKLMSNARNIHELTDNWDELVCDYIDVSLLNTSASFHFSNGILCLVNIICSMLI